MGPPVGEEWWDLNGWMPLGGYSATTFGALLRNDQDKYWWVPEGSTDDALGPYFPSNDETLLVKVNKKPLLGPAPSEKFQCAIMGTRDEDGWCYDRFFFKDSCEMQWLLNVFLREHMPTGGMPKVDKIKVKKGTQCLGEGYWMGPAPDSAFQSMTAWWNPIKIGSVLTFHSAFNLGGIDTLRYVIFWRSVPDSWK